MKTAVTGIKPTGIPHLGNYLGMYRPALELARDLRAFYFIADYHALTVEAPPEVRRELSHQVAATSLALGLDPSRAVLYRQSDLPEVCELAWILACVTPKGLLNRAHAYKAARDANLASGRDADLGINVGLFNYPVLMASDVLILRANAVPVGQDQQQHMEILRDIAAAFNRRYGKLLTLPEALIDARVATIPGLDGRKMSKSYGNVIPIFAEPAELRRLVMRIRTDSRGPAEPKDPETDLVFQLYRHLADADAVAGLLQRYEAGGVGYAEAKELLAEALEAALGEPRRRYAEVRRDHALLEAVLSQGAAQARERAAPLLRAVRQAVGLG
ncbi:MAG TPA: tryptophan--tRNA ligase [Candidatus Dormibacteraeota bacterium]|nr:tryptophan--tRNA ligase [Candidatus Dormibacteraeota bacterium]